MHLKVGDRVATYGFKGRSTGKITECRGEVIWVALDKLVDGNSVYQTHAKACRRLVKKKKLVFNFVNIPAGSFLMGSPKSEPGRCFDEIQHKVTLSKDFEMMATQVTQAQWEKFMGNNPSRFRGNPNNPVEMVSWYDVQEFIKKLNAKKDGYLYRLPTEAEWEYAARGHRSKSQTAYCFGDDVSMLVHYAWFYGNSDNKTHPVGLKKPNSFGLYDMHGNVWEWCEDAYANYNKNHWRDPVNHSGSGRVVRGGSWDSDARGARSGWRDYVHPGYRAGNVGFRLVRTK